MKYALFDAKFTELMLTTVNPSGSTATLVPEQVCTKLTGPAQTMRVGEWAGWVGRMGFSRHRIDVTLTNERGSHQVKLSIPPSDTLCGHGLSVECFPE